MVVFLDYPENGGSMLVRNVGFHIPIHTTSCSRRQKSSLVQLLEPHILGGRVGGITVIAVQTLMLEQAIH
jgi:hypothetical protein